MDFPFKPIVLVTGFGPFKDHPVNASWEAVKLINKQEIEDKHDVEVILLELPVTYENVDEFVPELWDTHEPKLMIHVGVSSIAKCLTLETQAHKKGYKRRDYCDRCPQDFTSPADGGIRMQTKFDVERICSTLNKDKGEVRAVSSMDAGRYLCEYIYYNSLAINDSRTLFVHVPDTHVASAANVAKDLQRVVEECLRQIDERELPELVRGVTQATLHGGDGGAASDHN